MKLNDNEKIYRGCVIGMINNIDDDLSALAYDLESCPGMASDAEIEEIYDMQQQLRSIVKRLIKELKPYGLVIN